MWTFNSIRIFTQEYENAYKQIWARLNPLGGGTVLQNFGWEDIITRLSFYIVGETDNAALKAMSRSGLAYELVSPEGSYGDFFVSSISLKRTKGICQSLRTDLAETAPVYLVEAEVYYDE